MIKVCHITSAHLSNDPRIFPKQCVSLANAGYSVTLIAPGESREEKGVHVIGVGTVQGRFARMTEITKRVYRAALKVNASIYHIHDPELLLYAMKLKKLGKIVVFDSHEDYVQNILEKSWIPWLLRVPISIAFSMYQKRVVSKIDAVIGVTPLICDFLAKISPNTVMITNYPITDARPTGVYARTNRICFAGGVKPQWMHAVVADAATKAGARYILAGSANETYLNKLKSLPCWNAVEYQGILPYESMPQLMTSCSVGMAVLDYIKNCGGTIGTLGITKLFEYMMAGLPVIFSDLVLWKEMNDKHNFGICVPPHDVDAIASAIKWLFDNPEEAEAMGKRGRAAVLGEYNWGTQEKVLLNLYSELLD